MKTRGLEGFVLSGKFVVCLLLAQFLLMPVATENFHWAVIGDIIGYTLSHAFFQQMYAYGWVFQWLALGVLLVLILNCLCIMQERLMCFMLSSRMLP